MKYLLLLLLLSAAAQADPFLSYERKGGFAGLHMALRVDSNGHVRSELKGAKTFSEDLSAAEMARLRDEARSLARARVKSIPVAADGYAWSVTWSGGVVRWGEPGPRPTAIGPLLLHLNAIQARLRK